MLDSDPPNPSYPDDTGPNPALCVAHGQDIRDLRSDVKELKGSNAAEQGLLRDVRERLIRLETQVGYISTTMTKHTDRASEAFFRYGWPIFLVIITAIVTHYATK
jgi:hypothetical protein